MGPEWLTRIIRRSYLVTLVSSVFLWMVWDWPHALGAAFGGFWCAANLWALKGLVEGICQYRSAWRVFFFAQIKIPVLYGMGFFVLITVPLSVGAAIFGFNIPFILLVFEAVFYPSHASNMAKRIP